MFRTSGRRVFVFYLIIIKENWIWAMTKHHTESTINISLANNLPIDSGIGK